LRKVLPAAIGLFALGIASASAADLARPYTKAPAIMPALYDWSGFYIGLNGGGGSARTCWDLMNLAGAPVVPVTSEGCHNATGGLVGGQIGYRWQAANWVFGLEAQGDWAQLKGSNPSSPAALTAIVTNQTKIDAIGLFTGQVGYAWNNGLFYVKGGAAVADERYQGIFTGVGGIPVGAVLDSKTEARWGGAIGTGFEFAFAPNWSVGVEYDHLFLGDHSNSFAATTLANSRIDNIKQNVDMGTVRVNYRFGGPVIPKY
jgi:outer membrane immunogenic protein